MKTRTRIVTWGLLVVLATASKSFANDDRADFESVAADLVIARPCWLAATMIGTALFIVSLPVSAMSKSVNKTARTLVAKPAHATFTRRLGDFSSVE